MRPLQELSNALIWVLCKLLTAEKYAFPEYQNAGCTASYFETYSTQLRIHTLVHLLQIKHQASVSTEVCLQWLVV